MTSEPNRTATPATLVLEDGTTFRGRGFGAAGTRIGEVVFNTAMTGYQEVLTDPSYHRQIVIFTAPHIGNYGVTGADNESRRVHAAGVVVREISPTISSHRAERDLPSLLGASDVVGISGIDTRRLVRHIRHEGAMQGVISTEIHDSDELARVAAESPRMEGANLVEEVTCPEPWVLPPRHGEPRFRVVAFDFGMKTSQAELLSELGCEVTVVPAGTNADVVASFEPDGVFLSNGPGDPAAVTSGISAVRALLRYQVPIFGICLGHQILGLGAGALSFKLPYGHHGSNHPVRNNVGAVLKDLPEVDTAARKLLTALQRPGSVAVEITSQNHGFALDSDSLPGDGPAGRIVPTHQNLNDGTNEGIASLDVPAFGVQYHPESAPGPHDARYLFPRFAALMETRRKVWN